MQPTTAEKRKFEELDLVGTVEAAEIVGWTSSKFALYHKRGKTPEPIGFIGGRPAWTRRQIHDFKETI